MGGTGRPALSIPSSLGVYVLVFGARLGSETQLHPRRALRLVKEVPQGVSCPPQKGAGAHQGCTALAPGLQLSRTIQDPASTAAARAASARPALLGGLEMAVAPRRGEPCPGEHGGWRARGGVWAAGGPH